MGQAMLIENLHFVVFEDLSFFYYTLYYTFTCLDSRNVSGY